MRLIDLDKALEEAEEECRMSDDWKVSHEMMNVFKYQPTVKAIPISELRRWLNKQDMPYKDYVIGVVEYAINAWEKENEG